MTGIAPLSPAHDRGLHAGDVIVKVQLTATDTPADVRNELAEMRKQGSRYVLLLVHDEEGNRSVALPLGEEGE